MARSNGSSWHRSVTKTAGKSTAICFVSKKLGDDGMRQVAAAVREAGNIETITLDQSNIGNFIGAKSLADTLRPPTLLSKLSVDKCKLGDKGVEALCTTLVFNNVLRELSLCGNSIGRGGAKMLAGVLKSNSSIGTLRLDSNKLGNYGVKYLAEALRLSQTTALHNLHLSDNTVSDKGAEALASCLESNTVLRVLELWKNSITNTGALALASSIKEHNKALGKLNLNGNQIGVSGVAELNNVLMAASSLTCLHLEGNPGRARQQRPTRVVIGTNENEDALSLSGRSLRGSVNSISLTAGSGRPRRVSDVVQGNVLQGSDDAVQEPLDSYDEEGKSVYHDTQTSSVGETKPLFFFVKAGEPEPRAPSLEYIPVGDPRFGPSINTCAGHSVSDVYDIQNVIAHGSFGTVYNAVNRRTNRAVAIKVGNPTILDHNDAHQDNDSIRDFASMGKYCQEIRSLKRLRNSHSSLLHMEEFYVENGSFYIVSESMGCNLGQWRASVAHFSEDMAREVARSLLSGIAYMHAHHVIHRDIKPPNILVRHDGDIPSLRIIDFGLSRALKSDNEWRQTFVGSLGYIAPEIYKNQGYRVEVDMFSFGVLLFRLLSAKRPFSSKSKRELALLVIGNKYKMDDDSWSRVSPEAKDFVRRLIIPRDRRLTAESASLHPWFLTRPTTQGDSNILSETGSNLEPYEDSDQGDSKFRSALVSIIRAGALDREIFARFGNDADALEGLDDELLKALTAGDKRKATCDTVGRRPIEPPGDYQVLDIPTSVIRQKWVGSVFVSHTGQDPEGSTFASHLCDSFRDEGIDFFFDAWNIHEGELFEARILEGVDTCAVFVCVLTSNYFYRHWCMKELDRAFHQGKIIIPVYLPVEPPDVTPEFQHRFTAAHTEKVQMDYQVIQRWLLNVRKLKQIQAVWNHSQPKDHQVEMKKRTVKAVKYKLEQEPLSSRV